ncbi:DUF4397 domain-containing protein [Parapedobacter deserti]|uniref:DUF4397 domain-containing protein n=1 Tax=Parapedobacter deserti TaxID=1912957 RepID=A0ABV7JIK8_9SPHI
MKYQTSNMRQQVVDISLSAFRTLGALPTFWSLMLIPLSVILFTRCAKEKLDHLVESPNPFDQGELSSIRIINAAEYFNVIANGDTLTSYAGFFTATSPSVPFGGPWYSTSTGTKHFPYHGYLGREWRIPQRLFRENGRLDLFFESIMGYPNDLSNPLNFRLGLTIQQTDARPVDFYIGPHPVEGDYLVVDRDETPPSRPDYFKIRVVNMASDFLTRPTFYEPLTLTYADGTPVHPGTTGIDANQRVTDFVELPYGTYQFRVLSYTGFQLPGTDGRPEHMIVDPATLAISARESYTQPAVNLHHVYAPIHSYQPGGVYTIHVYPAKFQFYTIGIPEASNFLENAFRIVQDNVPTANLSYGRIQGFSALPENGLSLRIASGKGIVDISYGKPSDYTTLPVGETGIELLNAAGSVLATISHVVEANQHYTVYAYPNDAGEPQLTMVANDLSGNNEMMPFRARFINLSPDFPYATFTRNDGEALGDERVVSNLRPGVASLKDPYITSNVYEAPYEILAYRSAPGQVPGAWADDVPVLYSRDFISRKELYARFDGNLPTYEPGYYTVALIGRTGDHVPEEQKAKMVIIKHNR